MPVQALCYKHILKGEDVAVQSKTGSGKTLAFLVPSLEILTRKGGNLLVLAPTHELAIQIHGVLNQLTKITSATVMGGGKKPIDKEAAQLEAQNPRFIVATPGRLLDHLQSGHLQNWSSGLRMIIFDEADRMHDMGFSRDIKKIYEFLPKTMQTLLFSATLSQEVLQQARLKPNYTSLSTIQAHEANVNEQCSQDYFFTNHKNIFGCLATILNQNKGKKILVFFHTNHVVKWISKCFKDNNINARAMCGKMNNSARATTIRDFTENSSIVVFATDVIARGMDIPDVDVVIQVGTPSEVAEYVHRIGRTSRAGKEGRAILILTNLDRPFLQKLKAANVELNELEVPHLTPIRIPPGSADRAFTAELGYLLHLYREAEFVKNALELHSAWGVKEITILGNLKSQLPVSFYTAFGMTKKPPKNRNRNRGPQDANQQGNNQEQARPPKQHVPQPQKQYNESNGQARPPRQQRQKQSGESSNGQAKSPKQPAPQKQSGESSNGQSKSPRQPAPQAPQKQSGESSNGQQLQSPKQRPPKKASGEANGEAKPNSPRPHPQKPAGGEANKQAKRAAENGSAQPPKRPRKVTQ